MMKSKLKIILASFILMTTIDIVFSSPILFDLGLDYLNVGLIFAIGLLLGPYGALGTVIGHILINFMEGYDPLSILSSAVITFGVSYLAYKLWYSCFKNDKTTKPRLNNIFHLVLFLSIIFICGFIYSELYGNLATIFLLYNNEENITISYIINFINSAFIYGILGIGLSEKIDFVVTPKISKRQVNRRLYRTLFISLIAITIISFFCDTINLNKTILIGMTVLIIILLIIYLTKPVENQIKTVNENTIIEKIIHVFIIITVIIAILGITFSYFNYNYLTTININSYIIEMPLLIIPDIIIILFFIPGIIILAYIEKKVIEPISAFSEIESFIKENEKIEAEGLLNIYSNYLNEKDEIGTLAQSYTDLINYNNNYIENIREIEGEKEHIKAELDIARKIQYSTLPTDHIMSDDFIVTGYSQPAKEVGGDFFDYYMLDEDNLALVIGDASGKGVPAALLAMITQVMTKQLLKHDKDPSKVLYSLNNQLSENNPESMFITLWIGIYNKTTKKLKFSNAGHNPPLIKQNNEFKYLKINSGLVLGIINDFEYINEEITLTDKFVAYTDGITDANNENGKMYGEDRLLNFINEIKDDDLLHSLLNDIHSFTKDADQYDDMTILYFNIK